MSSPALPSGVTRLERLLKAADFVRLLGQPGRARSALFAVHHVQAQPSRSRPAAHSLSTQLSTGLSELPTQLVDETPTAHWLGLVVPKRLARRAVTRNLVKRLVRATLAEQLAAGAPLPAGLWAVRLRAPLSREQFPSASSEALRRHLRADLSLLWQRAAHPRAPRGGKAAA